jgi:hypothetical protein
LLLWKSREKEALLFCREQALHIFHSSSINPNPSDWMVGSRGASNRSAILVLTQCFEKSPNALKNFHQYFPVLMQYFPLRVNSMGTLAQEDNWMIIEYICQDILFIKISPTTWTLILYSIVETLWGTLAGVMAARVPHTIWQFFL